MNVYESFGGRRFRLIQNRLIYFEQKIIKKFHNSNILGVDNEWASEAFAWTNVVINGRHSNSQ